MTPPADPVSAREIVKPFVIGANEQNLDKLAAELQRMTASNRNSKAIVESPQKS